MAYLTPPVFLSDADRAYLVEDDAGALYGRDVEQAYVHTALFDRDAAPTTGFDGSGGGSIIIVGGNKPPDQGQLWPRGDGSAP